MNDNDYNTGYIAEDYQSSVNDVYKETGLTYEDKEQLSDEIKELTQQYLDAGHSVSQIPYQQRHNAKFDRAWKTVRFHNTDKDTQDIIKELT